jgi:prophage tail gpP-like protein
MAVPESFTRDQAKISLTVNGESFEGWLQSEVDRSLEAISGTFSVPVSLVPGDPPKIGRQDAVEVRIGSQVVMTGYVLAAEPFYNRTDCGLRVMGRDRTGDLVRCSAIHKGGQWIKSTLDRICKDLVAPFGLEVRSDTDLGGPIADFKLSQGETVLDALSRAARLQGVMVTRDDTGHLLLTRAGLKTFDGAIVRGQNVIAMESIGSDEQRHSDYIAYAQAAVALKQFHGPGDAAALATFDQVRQIKSHIRDGQIGRYLPLIINADGNKTQAELDRLMEHTLRVRRGHSMGWKYLVEGWTYKGKPWPVNQRVTIRDDIAGLEGDKWLICSVRQHCDLKEGDVTELVVRPIEAYSTEKLQTSVKRRNYGNKGNTDTHMRGPTDGAPLR